MSMAGKRYYGADVPRSTGPHPDPLEQLRDQDRLREDITNAIIDNMPTLNGLRAAVDAIMAIVSVTNGDRQ
jgi:hypothetical protein